MQRCEDWPVLFEDMGGLLLEIRQLRKIMHVGVAGRGGACGGELELVQTSACSPDGAKRNPG